MQHIIPLTSLTKKKAMKMLLLCMFYFLGSLTIIENYNTDSKHASTIWSSRRLKGYGTSANNINMLIWVILVNKGFFFVLSILRLSGLGQGRRPNLPRGAGAR